MDFVIGVGLFVLTIGGLLLFFIFYRPLWENTAREPFTNILRRHKARFSFIILIGFAAVGGLIYLSLPRAWPWYTWVVPALGFLWLFIGHIFWAGIRWGRIHAATAWRCVEEIRLISESLEEGPTREGIEFASQELGSRLEAMEIPFRPADRSGKRRGLAERTSRW